MDNDHRDIREDIEQTIASYKLANWHAHTYLLHAFVLEHGKPFTSAKKYGRKGTPKQCFYNAFRTMMRYNLTYVEGFCVNKDIGYLFHHAWVMNEDEPDVALECTLTQPDNYLYFGVPMAQKDVIVASLKSGVYGVLDTGKGLNHDFMRDFQKPEKAA